jgi:hypothetical protein
MTTTKVAFPARNVQEWRELMKTDPAEVPFIRSMEDWQRELQRDDDKSPVSRLPQSDIDFFTASLVFNKGGLATANYDVLARSLTFYEFEKVWNRFGLHMDMFVNGEETPIKGLRSGVRDRRCVDHTWTNSFTDICTDNC